MKKMQWASVIALTVTALAGLTPAASAVSPTANEVHNTVAIAKPASASAASDPWIGYGASNPPPFSTLSADRGVDSRTYLPSCPKYYFCVYALYNQTSTQNYWRVWKFDKSTYLGLGQYQFYILHNFNYNTDGQWVVNNQVGYNWDVQMLDNNDREITCYTAPPDPRPANADPADYERRFRSVNYWPVWKIANDADNQC